MDNRMIMLLLALGVSPTTYATDTIPATESATPGVVLSVNHLRLHFQTQLILQKLKERGALSAIETENGVHLVILGEKLDQEFFNYLSHLQNVTLIEGSKELIISDGLTAAMAVSGELNDILPENDEALLLKELQEKMGTDLDKTLKDHAAASFA